jgi:hypothetical protein
MNFKEYLDDDISEINESFTDSKISTNVNYTRDRLDNLVVSVSSPILSSSTLSVDVDEFERPETKEYKSALSATKNKVEKLWSNFNSDLAKLTKELENTLNKL